MERDKKTDRNRPIWVRLGSKKERNAVLEKARNLKTAAAWKQVYINKDMTEAERKEAYQLRIELRERRLQEAAQKGKSKFVIHRGRVVNKDENVAGRERRTPQDGIPERTEGNNRPRSADRQREQ